mgnify:CR=1 FL=1
MRTRYIFTALAALILTSSCIKEEQGTDMPEGTGLLKVKLSVPEIEVKAASTPKFYAYVPSEVQAGTLNPIPESVLKKNDGAIYYNLPSDATEVVFSTFHGADGEKVDISADGEGNVWYGIDTEANSGSYFIADEILAGYVGDITVGSTEPKDVAIKRLTSKITTNFRVKDANGADLYLYNVISSVKVEYSGLGNSASVLKDGTVKSSGSHNEEITLKRHNDYLYTLDKGFIPSQEIPSVTVTITRSSGVVQIYTKSLGKKLDPNRHYTVNLNVTNINTGGLFVVNDPEVTVSQPISPTVTETEFFSVTNEMTIGGEAGNELMIDVATVLPYDWTFELDEAAAEYFSAEVVEGGIKLMAKEGNMGDIRFGNVTLKSKTGGYTKVLNIRQMSAIKHEIIMTYTGSYSAGYIVISGENITVQDPNDSNPRVFKTANSTQVRIDGLSAGKVLTVKGDIITELLAITYRTNSYQSNMQYEEHNGYYYNLNYGSEDYYTFEFKNCRHLETLIACPRNDALDLSGLPDLEKLVLGNSVVSTIKFSEGQGVEYIKAYKCPNIQQLDLRNISKTLSDAILYDCDALVGISFKNFAELKSVNLNACNSMASINLSGCTTLEEYSLSDNSAKSLDVSGCTSLKILRWTTTLDKLIHEGADAIETIGGGGYVTDFNFVGQKSLKIVQDVGTANFNVSGCTNLESIGKLSNVTNLNVSNCPLIKTLDVSFTSSSQTYSFSGCPALETIYFKGIVSPCDLSPLSALKVFHSTNMTGQSISTFDFSHNTLLEDLKLSSSNSSLASPYWFPLNNLILPQSIRSLDIFGMDKLTSLRKTNYKNLQNLSIEQCYSLDDIDFSGCTSLETLRIVKCRYLDYIKFIGCTGLKTIALEECDWLYDINFSNCSSLETLLMKNVCNTITLGNTGKLYLSGCSSLVSINRDAGDKKSYIPYISIFDFAGCKSLEHVNIYAADAKSLNFTDSPKLIYLDARNNQLSAAAINAMFATMPDRNVVDDGAVPGKYLLSGNGGSNGYNKAAAEAKGWYTTE